MLWKILIDKMIKGNFTVFTIEWNEQHFCYEDKNTKENTYMRNPKKIFFFQIE